MKKVFSVLSRIICGFFGIYFFNLLMPGPPGRPQDYFPFLYPVWYTGYEYAATGRKKEFRIRYENKIGYCGLRISGQHRG